MMPESRLAKIFGEVYQLPAREREKRIHELAGGDTELAAQVISLVDSYRQNPDFLEQPAALPIDFTTGKLATQPGIGRLLIDSEIGPYKILKLIGHGGMGQVYLVEQLRPIHRRLALKVLSFQKVSASSVARFEIERQTLALLNHPSIARIYDGGTIDGFFPYFVMEYVEGKSLDELLRESPPDFHARIQLFLKICDAIRHAHQKGLIHRDLKPSNILVESVDDQLSPKVIDFGLAKWLGEDLGGMNHDSGEIRVIGTLPFVSPEQLQNAAQSPDVRSDIYSLGTILYLLIAGATPFSRLSGSSPVSDLELIRRIREEDAVRPSRFIQNLPAGEMSPHRAELENLPRTLVSDLDWITLKCLEKNAGARYESVAELSADIRAGLAHMPVQAGPPGLAPRALKYIRRNKIQAFAVMMAAFMFTVLAVSYMQTRQAWLLASDRLAESTRAHERLRVANQEIETANTRLTGALADSEKFRAEAEKVSEFLVSAFSSPRPGESGAGLRVVDLIRDSIKKLMTSFEGNQAARGKLLLTLGNTLRAMGEFREALPPLVMALEIEARELGETAPATISCVCQIGKSLSALERYEEAAALYEKWRKTLESAGRQKTRQYESVMSNLGRMYLSLKRYDEALGVLRLIETLFPEIPKTDPYELAMIRQAISEIYAATGKQEEAIAIQRESLKSIEKGLGPGYPHSIAARHKLAVLLADSSHVEAETLLRENEQWIRQKFAPELPLFKTRMNELAKAYAKVGKQDEEKRILNELENLKTKSNNELGKK